MAGTTQGESRTALMTSTKRLIGRLDKRFNIEDCLICSLTLRDDDDEHIYLVPADLIKAAEKMGAVIQEWRDAE